MEENEAQVLDISSPYTVEFSIINEWTVKAKELEAEGFKPNKGTHEDRVIAHAGICPICLNRCTFAGFKRNRVKYERSHTIRLFVVCLPCNSADEF
jgi:hypothetical protein